MRCVCVVRDVAAVRNQLQRERELTRQHTVLDSTDDWEVEWDPDSKGVFELDMILDLKHGGIPVRIMKGNADYEGWVEVLRYTRSGEHWLPAVVKSVFRTRKQSPGGMIRERTWHLRGVSLDSTLKTVKHPDMLDLRAYGCNLTLSQSPSMGFRDKDVYYQWE